MKYLKIISSSLAAILVDDYNIDHDDVRALIEKINRNLEDAYLDMRLPQPLVTVDVVLGISCTLTVYGVEVEVGASEIDLREAALDTLSGGKVSGGDLKHADNIEVESAELDD